MKSFHSGTSEVYKSVVIWTVLLECVYSGVLNVISSRVSHGPDFLCFVFQRQNKVPWVVNSVFSYRKKYLLCLSFIETEKYTISPLEQWGYTYVCMRAYIHVCVCVKCNTFETQNRRFHSVYSNKNLETSMKPRKFTCQMFKL